MKKNEYIGIYDHKESNTFRPTLKSRIHKKSPVSKTMTCREDSCCVITKDKTHTHTSNLRIRKLTPKECLRLMGFDDKDYQALRDIGQSDAQIYHEAGDSIVTTVIAHLLSSLLFDNEDYLNKIENYISKGIIEDGRKREKRKD